VETLQPLDGVRVDVLGRRLRRTLRTDGTGFFAAIDLPPGEYGVRVAAPGGPARDARVRVSAGRAATANMLLGEGASARSLGDAGRVEPGTTVRVRAALVVGGTDTFLSTLYVQDVSGMGQVVPVLLDEAPVLPFQPGDVVAITGVWTHSEYGEPALRGRARLVDIRLWRPRPTAETRTDLERAGHEGVRTIEGVVAESAPGRMVLDLGRPVVVLLDGRKDPGIESVPAAIPAAPPGSRVRVTGIATRSDYDEAGEWKALLRPWTSRDVVVLAPPRPPAQRLLPWLAAALALVAALAAARRLLRR